MIQAEAPSKGGFCAEQAPQRIVSLVPSQTELLCELGLAERIVGRTRYCIHPADQVAEIPVVGGTKDLDLDKIRALRPDWLVANREENLQAPVEALAAEIPTTVTEVHNLEDALLMIRQLGQLAGVTEQSEQLAQQIKRGFTALRPLNPRPRVLYLIWRRPFMSVGQDSFIHAMLTRLGLENVCGDQLRYPSLEPEAIQALAPEWVLLSSEPYPFKAKHLQEMQALCPKAQVLLVDGELFSWYGSRLLKSAAYFQQLQQTFRPI